jgi:hypothetical protein
VSALESTGRPAARGWLTFTHVKWASFGHSAVYICLLVCWAVPGWHRGEMVFGFAHGIGWFVMCALCLLALHRRVIPLYVATCVAVIGAIGPFIGSAAFLREQRARVLRNGREHNRSGDHARDGRVGH